MDGHLITFKSHEANNNAIFRYKDQNKVVIKFDPREIRRGKNVFKIILDNILGLIQDFKEDFYTSFIEDQEYGILTLEFKQKEVFGKLKLGARIDINDLEDVIKKMLQKHELERSSSKSDNLSFCDFEKNEIESKDGDAQNSSKKETDDLIGKKYINFFEKNLINSKNYSQNKQKGSREEDDCLSFTSDINHKIQRAEKETREADLESKMGSWYHIFESNRLSQNYKGSPRIHNQIGRLEDSMFSSRSLTEQKDEGVPQINPPHQKQKSLTFVDKAAQEGYRTPVNHFKVQSFSDENNHSFFDENSWDQISQKTNKKVTYYQREQQQHQEFHRLLQREGSRDLNQRESFSSKSKNLNKVIDHVLDNWEMDKLKSEASSEGLMGLSQNFSNFQNAAYQGLKQIDIDINRRYKEQEDSSDSLSNADFKRYLPPPPNPRFYQQPILQARGGFNQERMRENELYMASSYTNSVKSFNSEYYHPHGPRGFQRGESWFPAGNTPRPNPHQVHSFTSQDLDFQKLNHKPHEFEKPTSGYYYQENDFSGQEQRNFSRQRQWDRQEFLSNNSNWVNANEGSFQDSKYKMNQYGYEEESYTKKDNFDFEPRSRGKPSMNFNRHSIMRINQTNRLKDEYEYSEFNPSNQRQEYIDDERLDLYRVRDRDQHHYHHRKHQYEQNQYNYSRDHDHQSFNSKQHYSHKQLFQRPGLNQRERDPQPQEYKRNSREYFKQINPKFSRGQPRDRAPNQLNWGIEALREDMEDCPKEYIKKRQKKVLKEVQTCCYKCGNSQQKGDSHQRDNAHSNHHHSHSHSHSNSHSHQYYNNQYHHNHHPPEHARAQEIGFRNQNMNKSNVESKINHRPDKYSFDNFERKYHQERYGRLPENNYERQNQSYNMNSEKNKMDFQKPNLIKPFYNDQNSRNSSKNLGSVEYWDSHLKSGQIPEKTRQSFRDDSKSNYHHQGDYNDQQSNLQANSYPKEHQARRGGPPESRYAKNQGIKHLDSTKNRTESDSSWNQNRSSENSSTLPSYTEPVKNPLPERQENPIQRGDFEPSQHQESKHEKIQLNSPAPEPLQQPLLNNQPKKNLEKITIQQQNLEVSSHKESRDEPLTSEIGRKKQEEDQNNRQKKAEKRKRKRAEKRLRKKMLKQKEKEELEAKISRTLSQPSEFGGTKLISMIAPKKFQKSEIKEISEKILPELKDKWMKITKIKDKLRKEKNQRDIEALKKAKKPNEGSKKTVLSEERDDDEIQSSCAVVLEPTLSRPEDSVVMKNPNEKRALPETKPHMIKRQSMPSRTHHPPNFNSITDYQEDTQFVFQGGLEEDKIMSSIPKFKGRGSMPSNSASIPNMADSLNQVYYPMGAVAGGQKSRFFVDAKN